MALAPIVEVDPVHPQPRTIERAVKVLEEGGLIAYPTDTYYGVGCDLNSKKAIDRLYGVKNRNRRKPLSLIKPHELPARHALIAMGGGRARKAFYQSLTMDRQP